MKRFLLISALLLGAIGYAQAPANYYNSATGTGYTLKTQLKNIITNGHQNTTYNQLWTFYSTAWRDNYYENDNTLLDMYSENPAGTDPYVYVIPTNQCGNYTGEGSCYNREHLIPESYFESVGLVNNINPRHDAHHVVPSDGKVNNWRNNLPFGVVGNVSTSPCNNGATNTPCRTQNNSKIGNNQNSGYSAGFAGKVFEPIDEFKGDIARAFFYFATRYEDLMDDYYSTSDVSSTQVKAMFDGTTNKVFNSSFLNILLTWHNQDPVSAKEIAVNNAAYTYQGNRNPFIDNPQYVTMIWGSPMSTDTFDALTGVNVYPNPSYNNEVNIYSTTALTEIQLISINGQVVQQKSNPVFTDNTLTLSNLPQGFYILKLASENATVSKKVIVN